MKLRFINLKKASIYKRHIATSFGFATHALGPRLKFFTPYNNNCNSKPVVFPAEGKKRLTGEHLQSEEVWEMLKGLSKPATHFFRYS